MTPCLHYSPCNEELVLENMCTAMGTINIEIPGGPLITKSSFVIIGNCLSVGNLMHRFSILHEFNLAIIKLQETTPAEHYSQNDLYLFVGTTWVQEIVWQIYHNGAINSKRIEDRIPFIEEATNPKASQPNIQTLPSPRLLKTHLSYDGIPKGASEDTKCKYIYIARNPKDAAVSNYKFLTSLGADTGLNAPWEFYANLFIQGKCK